MQATATTEQQPAGTVAARRPEKAVTVLQGGAAADPQPERVMRLDFTDFQGRLIAMGEPSREDARALAAGMDLLAALESCSDEFGHAAPDAGPEATLAKRVASLTDEAFEVAAGVLEDHEAEGFAHGGIEYEGQLTARRALQRAMSDAAFDNLLGPSIRGALLGLGSRPDPSVGSEFV